MHAWKQLTLFGAVIALAGCQPTVTEIPVEPPTEVTTEAAPNLPPSEVATPAPAKVPPEVAALSVDELLIQLTSPATRDTAAIALVGKGSEATAPLIAICNHENWEVRAAAVFALSQLGSDEAIIKQLATMRDNDQAPAVRDAAAFALDAIDERKATASK